MTNETVTIRKPHLIIRAVVVLFIWSFAFIDHNPMIRFEAIIGLSPSPVERFFGFKSLFSGMTEGVHQFVRLNFIDSLKANVFAPLVIPIIAYFTLTWTFPKIDTKTKEIIFFLSFVLISIIVNILN